MNNARVAEEQRKRVLANQMMEEERRRQQALQAAAVGGSRKVQAKPSVDADPDHLAGDDPEQEEMSFLQKVYNRTLKMANIVLPSTKKIGKQTSSPAYQDYRAGERNAEQIAKDYSRMNVEEKPWWVLPSFSFPEQEAKSLAESIPRAGISNGRKQVPVFKFLAPPSIISFGTMTRHRFTSDANPGAELRKDGIGAGNIYDANQPSLMARANFDTGEFVTKVRFPSELNFTQGEYACSAGYSANMYIQWKGIYSTVGADINYADINARGAGAQANISKGVYVEVQPAPLAAIAVLVILTPYDDIYALGAAVLKALQEAGRILQRVPVP